MILKKLLWLIKIRLRYTLKKKLLNQEDILSLPKHGNGFGLSAPKANFTYNIGDMSNFETFIIETQKNAGYAEKDIIYPEYITRKNYFADILGWLLSLAILTDSLDVPYEKYGRRR